MMEFNPRKYSEMCIEWSLKHDNKPPDEFVRYQLDYDVNDEELIRQALAQKKEFWLNNSDSPNPVLRRLWQFFLNQHDDLERRLLDPSQRRLLAFELGAVSDEPVEHVQQVDADCPDNPTGKIAGECRGPDVKLQWDDENGQVRILCNVLSPARGNQESKIVYEGNESTFIDRSHTPGTRIKYTLYRLENDILSKEGIETRPIVIWEQFYDIHITTGNGELKLDWNGVRGAEKVIVTRENRDGNERKQIEFPPAKKPYLDKGLSNGVQYTYHFEATYPGYIPKIIKVITGTPMSPPLAPSGPDFNVKSIPIDPVGGVYKIELSCLKPTDGELEFYRMEETQPGFTGDFLTEQELNQKRTLIPHSEKPGPGGTELTATDYSPHWGVNYYVPVVSRDIYQVPGVVKRGFRIGAVENLRQRDTREEGNVKITWDWPKHANHCFIIYEIGDKTKPGKEIISEHDFISQERCFPLPIAPSVLHEQKVGAHVAGIFKYVVNSETKTFLPDKKEFVAYKILPVTRVIFELLLNKEGWAENSEYESIQIRVEADQPDVMVPALVIYACEPPDPANRASREIKTRVEIIQAFTGSRTFTIKDKAFLKHRIYFRVEAADENDALSLEIVSRVSPDRSSLPFRPKGPSICYYCFKKVYKSNMLVRCAHPDCLGEEDEVLNKWWKTNKGRQGKLLISPENLIKRALHAVLRREECDHNYTEYCCPKCHNTLPGMENRSDELIISIVGGIQSGKTVYLGVLLSAFMETLTKKYHYNLEPLNDEVRERYDRIYADPIRKLNLPLITNRSNPEVRHPIIFQVSKGDSFSIKTLVFYDAPGELFYNIKEMIRLNEYIKHSHAIFFMIDSEESTIVRDRMKILRGAQNYSHEALLQRIYELLTKNLSKQPLLKIPIALIVTKADGLSDITRMNNNHLILDGSPLKRESIHGPAFNWAEGEVEHQYALRLIDCMFPGISASVSGKFEFWKCFTVSALGHHPDQIKGKLREPAKPKKVLDPLIWLLDLYGWNDKNNR